MRFAPLFSSALIFFAACGSSGDDGPDASVSPDSGSTAPDSGVARKLELQVGSVFPPGTAVKDGYAGASAVVAADGKLTIDVADNGVALLEEANPTSSVSFTWDNATVYFVITDRFFNGDTSNDRSYGRRPDGLQEVGTWHGGDLRGLTEKLDYLEDLGVNAVWFSAVYEQVHGWVGGGNGDFPHYGYHGYWALDYTRMDRNFGTPEDLRAFVRAAHQRGIRVVMDVVMNHPGYATGHDLLEYLPEVFTSTFSVDWEPAPNGTWHDWNMLVDYNSNAWVNWWGPSWIRAGFPGHNMPGMDDLRGSLAYLPDFITEDFRVAPIPPLFMRKTDTGVVAIPNATVRTYLTTWLSDWVRQYGLDGFRADTAKHVEKASWKALKDASVAALREWKAANPSAKLDDLDFWMTGEVFPHGVVKDDYFTAGGFDSLINFDFQRAAANVLRNDDALDTLYSMYATALNGDPTFNVLSYASSHDTYLFFEENGRDLQKQADLGFAMLMLPGAVQIFYGDETARPEGPSASDPTQGTRSDMNWDNHDAALLAHWQKLGTFRNRHPAVGAGAHQRLDFDGGYAFARTSNRDRVVVVRMAE